MDALDLNVHERDDYEGKVVVFNGCQYVVGPLLGMGAERIVHTLTNERSQLSLHVIKFLRWSRPRGIYTKQIAALRADPELARVLVVTLEFEVRGGIVELELNIGAPTRVDKATELARKGLAALGGENPFALESKKHFEEALRINPAHTHALYGMAHALWRLDEQFHALSMIENAVGIEPHVLHYWRTYIDLALATDQIGFALSLYRQAVRIFENVHDLDELGTELLLDTGNPEQAKSCLAEATLTAERRQELQTRVDEAISARARAVTLMRTARTNVMAKEWRRASSLLLEAQKIYNRDPELCMNTGFALLHEGDSRVGAALLMQAASVMSDVMAPVCTSNAGFAMIKARDSQSAMRLLDITAYRLAALHGGTIPANEIDLPGVGIWIDGRELMAERISTAATLIAEGIESAAAAQYSVTDRVQALEAAYRQAAATSR